MHIVPAYSGRGYHTLRSCGILTHMHVILDYSNEINSHVKI